LNPATIKNLTLGKNECTSMFIRGVAQKKEKNESVFTYKVQ
jgi:hypothetical protein